MMRTFRNRRFVVLLIIPCVMIVGWQNGIWKKKNNFVQDLKVSSSRTTLQLQKCPDTLRKMTVGRWVKKNVTQKEVDYVEEFLIKSWNELGLPTSLSRADDKCGNVSLPSHWKYRALCDYKGPKPCCYQNKCIAASMAKCSCDNCYDMRSRINAELAVWKPEDPRCQVKNFTAAEACRLLGGTEMFVVGDSYMRHLYTAFKMIVNNDGRFGGLKRHIAKDKEKRLMCEGVFSFELKACRYLIERTITSHCNRTFFMKYIGQSWSRLEPKLFDLVKYSMQKDKKVILMIAQGLYEMNATKTQFYLKRSMEMLKAHGAKWPLFIWGNMHAPGLLKSPLYYWQGFDRVKQFNKDMTKYLAQYHVPILDTFEMTSNTVSFDGSHYAQGVNIAKAQVLLNFLQERQESNKV